MRNQPIITLLISQALFFSGAVASPAGYTTLGRGVTHHTKPQALIDSAVNELANKFMNNSKSVGLSIGIIKDGRIYTYNYGEAEKGKHQRPTANTLYAIGSVTKTFAATLLAQAMLEKKVKLDDDVRKYLDGDYPNLEFQGQPVELIHLLNHVSGLPRFLFEVPAAAPPDYVRQKQLNYSREDFYRDLHRVKLESVPGTKFQYSNAAGQLLGYTLERLYGMSFEELVRARITGPLGMNSTKITLSPSEKRHYKGYDENGAVVPDNPDQIQAAGALKSTLADMLKYAAWHLAEKDEAVRMTHQPTLNLVNNYWVALNWQMFKLPYYRAIWQQGSLPGFTSYCAIFPELKLGIVVLANEFDPSSSDKLTDMVKQIAKTIEPRAADLP